MDILRVITISGMATFQQGCEGHKLPTISSDALLKWFKMFIIGSNL